MTPRSNRQKIRRCNPWQLLWSLIQRTLRLHAGTPAHKQNSTLCSVLQCFAHKQNRIQRTFLIHLQQIGVKTYSCVCKEHRHKTWGAVYHTVPFLLSDFSKSGFPTCRVVEKTYTQRAQNVKIRAIKYNTVTQRDVLHPLSLFLHVFNHIKCFLALCCLLSFPSCLVFSRLLFQSYFRLTKETWNRVQKFTMGFSPSVCIFPCVCLHVVCVCVCVCEGVWLRG